MPFVLMDTIVAQEVDSASFAGNKSGFNDAREDIPSIPNSQSSSLNDPSSITTSQTSVSCDQRAVASEAERNAHIESRGVLAGGLKSPSTTTAPPPTSSSSTALYRSQAPHGQKRMSNGHLKSPSIDSPTSPSNATFRGFHARRLSSVSSGSQVGEVSETPPSIGKLLRNGQLAAQLRTRLSYALVKVQNGWQDRTIDEVESLTSGQTSITPPTPGLQQPKGSSSHDGPHLEKNKFSQSLERSTTLPNERSSTPHEHVRSPRKDNGTAAGQALLYPNPQSSRSARQQPNGSRNGPAYQGKNLISAGPRLAPAFDVSPRDARRVAQPNPPRLNTSSVSNLSNHSSASTLSSNPPSTPPPRHSSLAKSPSSTTPMEQDAIETLLTMSSPGNSQHGPMYGHLPGSPLRNHFRPPERHVGFVNENLCRNYPDPPSRAHKAKLRTDEDVDQYLDQMSKDDESSDE